MPSTFLKNTNDRLVSPCIWSDGDLEALTRCPSCGDVNGAILHRGVTDEAFLTSADSWVIYSCRACGCAYLNPRPKPSAIGKAYKNYYTHDVPNETAAGGRFAKVKLILRNGYLNSKYGYHLAPASAWGYWLAILSPWRQCRFDHGVRHLNAVSGGRLLDIGCGGGEFLRYAQICGWKAEGLDPDPAAAASHTGDLRVSTGGLPETGLASEGFDAITLSHLIEHVHDPKLALREISRILRPGGVLWLATPNINSLGHKIFGRHWRGLESPRHLVLFSPRNLAQAIKAAGFENVEQRRTHSCADWYWQASYRMAKGEDPQLSTASPLPLHLKMLACLHDCVVYFFPRFGEEIIFTARRPF